MILLQAVLVFIFMIILKIYDELTQKIMSQKTYSKAHSMVFVLSFVFLTMILFLRYNNVGLILLDIGVFLNMAVIIANKGYMPVDMNALKKVVSLYEPNPSDETILKEMDELDELQAIHRRHMIMSSKTKLNILGDKYGYSIQSIGDMFISAGIILIIFEVVLYLVLIII